MKKLDETWHLVEFLINNGLPYYIQIELKGKELKKHDSNIFDLRRILYGKYVTKEQFDKDGDKQQLYFKTGTQIGIADGDSISSDNNTDVFIFTGEKVTFDPKSKENAIKLITAPQTPNEKSFVVTDSKRLYRLTGNEPSSIDIIDDVSILGGNKIDISEFRLQVAPLSDDDFKNAVATASASNDGDKNKRKKIVTDDTNSYVVNLSLGCKVTSIQTLRKSLEMVRASLENKDDVIKKEAMDIIKLINGLLQNPEFAKNDGFDDFKEKVFGFTYKIPGTERKYGIAQIMTFFEQEKDNLPKDLIKGFFMLLTLLGHGPAGENGACLAFDRPQSIEVIEYTKTLENGDIVTTKKLGSKMNMEGFGSELEKLNSTNAPKEEDAKKAEGEAAAAAAAAAGAKDEGTASNKEGEKVAGTQGGEEGKDKQTGKNSMMARDIEVQEKAAEAEATSVAVASIAVASGQASEQASEPQHVKFIPPDNEKPPPPPLPPSQEVVAINKLYEKYEGKNQKIKQIIDLRKYYDAGLKKLVPLLLKIFTNSIESYEKSNKDKQKNNYLGTEEYKTIKGQLEKELNIFKKTNYKYIKDETSACNEVISEFSPSFFTFGEKKELAKKICTLFEKYVHIIKNFNEAYDYFNRHHDMVPVIGASIWGATKTDIEGSFKNSFDFLTQFTIDLEKEEKYTLELEEQFKQTSK